MAFLLLALCEYAAKIIEKAGFKMASVKQFFRDLNAKINVIESIREDQRQLSGRVFRLEENYRLVVAECRQLAIENKRLILQLQGVRKNGHS